MPSAELRAAVRTRVPSGLRDRSEANAAPRASVATLLSLQRSAGNTAVAGQLARRAKTTPIVPDREVLHLQRCGPVPCDCSDEERASAESAPVQRAVQESVVSEPSPLRPRPSVCLVHLHGNETGALAAAQSLVPRCDVNLVHLNNTTRHIHIAVGSTVCEADPNRIFSDTAIEAQWSRWNRGPAARDPVKTTAIADLKAFRDQQLWPAIRRGMGVPGTFEEEAAEGGPCREGAPVAAFHNNDASSSIDILAYCPGPGGPAACGDRQGSEARSGATDTSVADNPHIERGQDKDDFFLVTKRGDFDALVAQGKNVVLQAPGVSDDGSLSVRFASGRYANVEAELGGPRARNEAMGADAITQLGATCRPPAVQRQEVGDGQEVGNGQEPTGEADPLSSVLSWLRHLLDEAIRVLDQVGTMPAPLPRESPPPTGLPATCRTFADQAALDAAKARISSTVVTPMAVRDIVSWICGLSPPPASVTAEATAQRDCMLAAIRTSARRPGSPLRLGPGSATHSGHRDFARQRAIWERKFSFADRAHGGVPFDRISDQARARCPVLGADIRWDPDNPTHRTCWLHTLSAAERQQEILQASSAPGISRHHWGTDFDLFDPDMNPKKWEVGGAFADEYSWMLRNASTYGFIQSFTPMSTFMAAGYIEERWHWSYYPASQALLEFARGHQADIEARLAAEWGTGTQFSHIRAHWREFMFNVNERGWF